LPVLSSAGRHTNFGALECNSSLGDMYSLIRRIGPQFQFITIAIARINTPHWVRLPFRQPNNIDFLSAASQEFLNAMKHGTPYAIGNDKIPTNWSELATAVTGNPIALAFIYKCLMHSIVTILVGLKPSKQSGSDNINNRSCRFTSESLNDSGGVIVGNADAFSGVHEATHLTPFSALNPAVLQGNSDIQDLCHRPSLKYLTVCFAPDCLVNTTSKT